MTTHKVNVDRAGVYLWRNAAVKSKVSSLNYDAEVTVTSYPASKVAIVNLSINNFDPPFCMYLADLVLIASEPPVEPPADETFTVEIGKNKVEFEQLPGQVFANENRITYGRVS